MPERQKAGNIKPFRAWETLSLSLCLPLSRARVPPPPRSPSKAAFGSDATQSLCHCRPFCGVSVRRDGQTLNADSVFVALRESERERERRVEWDMERGTGPGPDGPGQAERGFLEGRQEMECRPATGEARRHVTFPDANGNVLGFFGCFFFFQSPSCVVAERQQRTRGGGGNKSWIKVQLTEEGWRELAAAKTRLCVFRNLLLEGPENRANARSHGNKKKGCCLLKEKKKERKSRARTRRCILCR